MGRVLSEIVFVGGAEIDGVSRSFWDSFLSHDLKFFLYETLKR